MNKLIIAIATIVSLMPVSAYAEEPMTELGIYLFASEVSGDVEVRNVTIDVDASGTKRTSRFDTPRAENGQ
jgi:hypothetical protein